MCCSRQLVVNSFQCPLFRNKEQRRCTPYLPFLRMAAIVPAAAACEDCHKEFSANTKAVLKIGCLCGDRSLHRKCAPAYANHLWANRSTNFREFPVCPKCTRILSIGQGSTFFNACYDTMLEGEKVCERVHRMLQAQLPAACAGLAQPEPVLCKRYSDRRNVLRLQAVQNSCNAECLNVWRSVRGDVLLEVASRQRAFRKYLLQDVQSHMEGESSIIWRSAPCKKGEEPDVSM